MLIFFLCMQMKSAHHSALGRETSARVVPMAVKRRAKLTPRIASWGNVTGGSRGRSLMVRGCWRAGGVPGMGTGLEVKVLYGASW
jgi:hypothetical protein